MASFKADNEQGKLVTHRDNLEHWEVSQYKSFLKWCNFHLSKKSMELQDFEDDFVDGYKLGQLVEALSGAALAGLSKAPKMKIQRVSNVQVSLSFITGAGIKLVNIGGEDIVDRNLRLILGLIWSLMEFFQIGKAQQSGTKRNRSDVIAWLSEHSGVPVTNLGTSLQDGEALAALTKTPANTPVERITGALRRMNEQYNVPILLDAADFVEYPDEKSMLVQLALMMDLAAADFPAVARKPVRMSSAPSPNRTNSGARPSSARDLNAERAEADRKRAEESQREEEKRRAEDRARDEERRKRDEEDERRRQEERKLEDARREAERQAEEVKAREERRKRDEEDDKRRAEERRLEEERREADRKEEERAREERRKRDEEDEERRAEERRADDERRDAERREEERREAERKAAERKEEERAREERRKRDEEFEKRRAEERRADDERREAERKEEERREQDRRAQLKREEERRAEERRREEEKEEQRRAEQRRREEEARSAQAFDASSLDELDALVLHLDKRTTQSDRERHVADAQARDSEARRAEEARREEARKEEARRAEALRVQQQQQHVVARTTDLSMLDDLASELERQSNAPASSSTRSSSAVRGYAQEESLDDLDNLVGELNRQSQRTTQSASTAVRVSAAPQPDRVELAALHAPGRFPDGYMMGELETVVVEAINSVRSNPRYWADYLDKDIRSRFDGDVMIRVEEGQRVGIQQREGQRALNEAIQVLRNSSALPAIQSAANVCRACRSCVNEIGGRGGHGTDATSRLASYGHYTGRAVENACFGALDGREVVVDFLLSDGDVSRDARNNILDPKFKYMGVAFASHNSQYRTMFNMVFTENWSDRRL